MWRQLQPTTTFAMFFHLHYTFWPSFVPSVFLSLFFLTDTFAFAVSCFIYCLLIVLLSSSFYPSAKPFFLPRFVGAFETTGITTVSNHRGASYDFVLITCCLISKATHFHRDGHYIYVIRGLTLLLLVAGTTGGTKINMSPAVTMMNRLCSVNNGASLQLSIKTSVCISEWPSDNVSVHVHCKPVKR